MKKGKVLYTYFEEEISEKTIDECSGLLFELGEKYEYERSQVIPAVFTIEELLSKYLGREEKVPFKVFALKRKSTFYLGIAITAERDEEVNSGGGQYGGFISGIFRNVGIIPEHEYEDGTNYYYFKTYRKPFSAILKLLIALAFAFGVGLLGMYIPESTRAFIDVSVFTPVYTAFLAALNCIAGPLVFTTVTWGICGMGDTRTFRLLGKRILVSHFAATVFFAAFAAAVTLPLYHLNFGTADMHQSNLNSLMDLVFGMVPHDRVTPFANGNILQIVFFATTVGVTLTYLGQRASVLIKFVEQASYLTQTLIEVVSKGIPVFVFLVLVKMIWGGSLSEVTSIIKVIIILIGLVLMYMIMTLAFTAIKNKVNPVLLIKKGLPTFIYAFTTASSTAVLPISAEACKKSYGLSEKTYRFGLPLGMVTYRPAVAMGYMSLLYFCAEVYQIEVSFIWFVTMVLVVCVLAIASPPIPGGGLAAYTILFTQAGLPVEAIAIALACDTIFDFFTTGSQQMMLPLVMVNRVKKLGYVNEKVLHYDVDKDK